MKIPESTDDATILRAEIDELKRRLAALEAGPAVTKQTFAEKVRRRLAPRKLALLIAAVVLVSATIVFGQGAIDAIFINPQGKVGIGISTPSAKLDVAGSGWFRNDTGALPATAGKGLRAFYDPGQNVGELFSWDYGTSSPINLMLQHSGGNVGIGTTPTSGNKLSVAGNTDVSGVLTTGTLNSTNSLRADAQSFLFNKGSADSSSNVVLRNDGNKAHLYPWGTGTTTNTLSIGEVGRTNLQVSGDTYIRGTLTSQGRYQRDDNSETTYPVSPRYHLSLTAANYGGRTRMIPQQVINDLCGDQDGCEFRLGMTRWDNDSSTQTASMVGLLYYVPGDGRWRVNSLANNVEGRDGNNATNHIANIWDTCFFTDGNYSSYKDNSDPNLGLSLLVWNGSGGAGRTCELTLID